MLTATQEIKIDMLFGGFIKQCRMEGKSPVTIKNFRDNFELLKRFKPDLQPEDLTPRLITDFFVYLQERERKIGNQMVIRELKNSTLHTIRRKLQSFTDWLVANGHISRSPFEGIKFPDVNYTYKKALTKDEFDKVFLAISRDIRWPNKLLKTRNLAMIMLLVLTGIRRGELVGLKVSDLDMENKVLTVRGETSKSRRERRLRICRELVPYFDDYLKERADYTTPYLWVSNNGDRNLTMNGIKHFTEYLKRVTGVNCHLHRFRHTFAVNLYQSNGVRDPLAVKEALGHLNFRTTIGYLRSLPDSNVLNQMDDMRTSKFK